MMSASEVKANVCWQALSWTSEGYYGVYDYEWTAANAEYIFFCSFIFIFFCYNLNLDCSHEPTKTHMHRIHPP